MIDRSISVNHMSTFSTFQKRTLIAFALLWLSTAHVVAQQQAFVFPDADTYTRPGVNAGQDDVLEVLDNGGGDFMAYIRFRLSDFNIDEISSAELTLHKVPGIRNDTITSGRFDVYGLSNIPGNTSQYWNEVTVSDSGLGYEYHNTGGNGLDLNRVYNLDAGSGANVVETVNNNITAQRLSGPDLVSFLNERVDDDGFATLIALVDAGAVRGWGYASREHPDDGLRASLDIEYTTLPPSQDPPRQVERLESRCRRSKTFVQSGVYWLATFWSRPSQRRVQSLSVNQ